MDHVKLPIVVRKATAGDVASMQAVDVAARRRFREIDDPHISRAADDQPYWTEGLTRAATEQRAWVAIDDLGAVIGFAVAWVIDGEGHLDELAVTPAHGRRGIGRALVDEVLEWTAARGLPSCTLITFREVPWNAPFYEKLGFEAVTALTPALQAALDQGATWGFPAMSSCADRSWTLVAPTHNRMRRVRDRASWVGRLIAAGLAAVVLCSCGDRMSPAGVVGFALTRSLVAQSPG